MTGRILVVDDEQAIRSVLTRVLRSKGYEVQTAASGEECLAAAARLKPHVILLDLKMPGMDGLETLERLAGNRFEGKVVMMTAYGSIPGAVEAMRRGAFDYIAKPFDNDEMVIVIERALERLSLEVELLEAKSRLQDKYSVTGIITNNPEMRRLLEIVIQVAPTDAPVLITGESGTGKELVARAVHRHSAHKDGPFVALNCGALPANLVESELFGYRQGAFTGAARSKPGLVTEADGGTLFLDEISEMGSEIQVKLLRFLQDGEFIPLGDTVPRRVGVRIVAASNKDLPRAIAEGRFREDLFYRLNVVQISIPPLRERPEDIVPLVNHFVAKHGEAIGKGAYGFSPSVIDAFQLYAWPGNVRELENVVHSALVMSQGTSIRLEDLPANFIGRGAEDLDAEKAGSLGERVASVAGRIEKKEILAALRESGGNQSEAARRLGINRRTLIRKMKRYSIAPRKQL
jgi:two-component system response regulator HydG